MFIQEHRSILEQNIKDFAKSKQNFVVIKDNRFISCLYVNVTTIINIYEKDFYTYCFVGIVVS